MVDKKSVLVGQVEPMSKPIRYPRVCCVSFFTALHYSPCLSRDTILLSLTILLLIVSFDSYQRLTTCFICCSHPHHISVPQSSPQPIAKLHPLFPLSCFCRMAAMQSSQVGRTFAASLPPSSHRSRPMPLTPPLLPRDCYALCSMLQLCTY